MFEEMTLCSDVVHSEECKRTSQPSAKKRRRRSKRSRKATPNKHKNQHSARQRNRITPKFEKIVTRSMRRKYEQQLGNELQQQQQQSQEEHQTQPSQQLPRTNNQPEENDRVQIPVEKTAEETHEQVTFNIMSLFSKQNT
jgi:hypothetical protein